ncbi:response regulator transcription factor (plasmid) [Agrobacterium tumefaciens]|jgi:two-component system nitrate/nitrite response regulator NarL|uniref:response regulator n=1 Tax=Agrobacterium tumefaciens TaxID=358 RepID=UPI000977D8CA|nr:response regulator transcription factor [Agrobacterium tumefaciens]MDR5011915.1 response regulator transcription factor [Agrobacterium tumefaciens]NTA62361.1 response regulator transcription factor [Agrobacterium tumefaciens]OMP72358.1 DNA-binding response regulator [Agrobacterium tumefaciens]QTQ86300.1 response regulator transcription factor [Agrobacterium tumefaciens]UXS99969.1 response regulator transcription factor [Agrobacterium tumefaciens]
MNVHPIRVLLVDNHPLILDGLKAVLETYEHITVVGTAVSAVAGIDAAVATQPHVVLMDINMPQINGIDALELFKEKQLSARVLMLSMHDSREYISTSVMYGAAGYILKDVATEEIVVAIGTVAAGGTYFSSGVRDVLMESATGRLKELTTREQDVLLLIARGKSNRDAAVALDIAESTMETHRKNIKRKLDIATTAGLIRYAIDHGLIKE